MDNRKRYQVFISSTFTDLKDERDKVMRAVLELKCFPAGMELFPAKDKKQFDYIKQVINESDYYVLIIGARYGSLDSDGFSYTEKEYDYAVRQRKPIYAFLHGDIKSIPLGKADDDKKMRLKLEAFKAKVENGGHLVNYWTDTFELKSQVFHSLHEDFEDEQRKSKRTGWVRADSIGGDADSQKEIEELKKEIEKRQNEVKSLEKKVKRLNTELEKYKASSMTIISKPHLQMMEISIPDTDVTFKMVRVEGGSFMMGADDDDKEAFPNERSAHAVTLSDYWIGETQVTQELWQAVMGENPSKFSGEQNLPVERVSWNDCQKFIERLNKMTSRNFHLPTEAQWEFAARGGNLGKKNRNKYSGGNFDLESIAWHGENSEGKTHPVAKLYPNQLGLYDMSGNVWEWCKDGFDNEYYNKSQTKDPECIASSFSPCICRGGGWIFPDKYCRVSCRDHYFPTNKSNCIGLRLAL